MQQNDKKNLIILAKKIKKLRMEKSNSLNAFTFEKGLVTSATLSRIENALVDVKFTTLIKIAQILDISLPKLFENLKFIHYEE